MALTDIDYKVCVRCFTYNQAGYIEDTMNSFCKQRTNFPFVCCIVDDCSTDGEQDVIYNYMLLYFEEPISDYQTEYGHVCVAKHKKNENCFFMFLALNKNRYGQYVKYDYISEWRDKAIYEACCEGDDYWLTDDKLQIQYNALENNPDIDMCSCGTHCYRDGALICSFQPTDDERVLSLEEVILGGGEFVGTNSLMYRLSMFNTPYSFFKVMLLDYFLQIYGALRGGIYHIPNYMAAYRLSSNGSWSQSMGKCPDAYSDFLLRIISTLSVLDYETNYTHHDVIKKAEQKWLMSLYYSGFKCSFFNDNVRALSLKARIKYLLVFLKKFFIS